MVHDTDPFNRWEACNELQMQSLLNMAVEDAPSNSALIDAMAIIISDDTVDPAFRALVMSLPSESEMARRLIAQDQKVDPNKLYRARGSFSDALAEKLFELLTELYHRHLVSEPYQPDTKQTAARKLTNAALSYISRKDGGTLAAKQFANADNMTLQASALKSLLRIGSGNSELEAFYKQWKGERLVIDRWFALQIGTASPETLLPVAQKLTEHSDFSIKNPNRFRALIATFSQNFAGFHQSSGEGYQFVADWLIKSDALNPNLTARLCGAFQEGPFDQEGKTYLVSNLKRLNKTASANTSEIVTRILSKLE